MENCCICSRLVDETRVFVKLDREGFVDDEISPVCDYCAEHNPMLEGYEELKNDNPDYFSIVQDICFGKSMQSAPTRFNQLEDFRKGDNVFVDPAIDTDKEYKDKIGEFRTYMGNGYASVLIDGVSILLHPESLYLRN